MAETADRETKTIKILLTKYSDCISSLLYYVGGKGYTHASISLESGRDSDFYSFNYNGFCVETVEKHRQRGVSKSKYYELAVSRAAYERIQKRLQFFKEHKEKFKYTRLGVLFCLLHVPFCWKNHYFCSQFVAELLGSSDETALPKPAGLYLPNHFQHELERNPNLIKVGYNII
ncbi:hypothetical protein [Clostridium transplantifaecale]|uniref:hypothetical protein n=1 Tax=Clostridium transplantifaecale TaxID=2479838 RepID=UPI000F639327|nr:hypothetical protein [Clostridium transplantifaecale]